MERRPSIGLERKLTEELALDHYTKGDATLNSSPSRWDMFKILFFMSWPMTITFSIEMGIALVPLLYIGRIGPEELGAASLANIFMNCSCFTFVYGMAAAIDVFGSQAYGMGSFATVGLVTQKTMFTTFIFSLIILPVWGFAATPFFTFLGQNERVVDLVQQYLYYRMPAVWPLFTYECLERFLSCRGVTHPSLYTASLTLGFEVLLCYYMVDSLGFIGAPLACTLCNYLNCALLSLYIWYNGYAGEYWPSCSRKIYQNMGEVLTIGLQGALSLLIEWGSFEVTTILAGKISSNGLAVHSVAANTASFLYMVPLSFGIAVSVLVGNGLGKGDPDEARRGSIVGLMCNSVWTAVSVTLVYTLRNQWVFVFVDADTSSADVIAASGPVFMALAVYIGCDANQCHLGYIMRGAGLQKIGTMANLCFPALGLPLAWLFGLHYGWGVPGIWYGMAIGNAFSTAIMLIAYFCINWEREAENAKARVEAQEAGLDCGNDGDPGDVLDRSSNDNDLKKSLLPL